MANVKKVYQFWYKSSELSITQYIWICAVSEKQAKYFFFKAGYCHMYDFSRTPIYWKCQSDDSRWGMINYGDILG